ncbi:hypothetical protein [Neolewinella persica]|uniref:hypothetical protein n=1 Tax=Neolewinella persica TaxID=70998 RepID=UPI00036F3E42|nr:hypothetical protein [Neolewinella persica]
MDAFNIFRINCWLEDLEGENYENSIIAIVLEALIAKDNEAQSRLGLFMFVTNRMGIKVPFDKFNQFLERDKKLLIEPLKDDMLVSIHPDKLEEIYERIDKYSIEKHVNKFITNNKVEDKYKKSIYDILLKSVYININTFVTDDLKSLISEDVKRHFEPDEIDLFNQFLAYDDADKNRSIYSLFSKSIEFAILTSGRGVSSIGGEIFKGKEYFLDANIVIRAIGVDGDERKESIVNVLDSCLNSGIIFKISRVTKKEIDEIIETKNKQIKRKTTRAAEQILLPILDDLPFNNSFETDYLKKRKSNQVSSPNRYKLHLYEELEKFYSKYAISIEKIAGLRSKEFTDYSNFLYVQKTESYGKKSYQRAASLVDAKNILHVRSIRSSNNYNYKDVKSFYLTTDASLNEIVASENMSRISETILPSQLFIVHNSFTKKEAVEDYNDFVKFIKLRRSSFKFPGQDIFRYLAQVKPITSNPVDVKNSIIAYCNYRYENRDKFRLKTLEIIPLEDFTKSHFEEVLADKRLDASKYLDARTKAIKKLDDSDVLANYITYAIEFLILVLISVTVYYMSKNAASSLIVTALIVLLRVIIFFFRKDFSLRNTIRFIIFRFLSNRSPFCKVYPDDEEYMNQIILRQK